MHLNYSGTVSVWKPAEGKPLVTGVQYTPVSSGDRCSSPSTAPQLSQTWSVCNTLSAPLNAALSQFLLTCCSLSAPPSVLTVLPGKLSWGSCPTGKCSAPTQPWCPLPSMLLLFLKVLISGPLSPFCCGYSQLFSLPGPFRLITGWNDSSSFWCSNQTKFSEILNFSINWCQWWRLFDWNGWRLKDSS